MRREEQNALKARLRAIVTIAALRRSDPGAPGARAIDTASEQELAFAAQNVDHSEAGRALAQRALAQRVGEAEADRRIESFIDTMPAPSWIEARDVAGGDGVFFGARVWILRAVFAAALASIAIWFGVAWDLADREKAAFEIAIAQNLVTSEEVAEAFRIPASFNNGELSTDQKKQKLRERQAVNALFAEYDRRSSISGNAGLGAMVLFPLYSIMLGWRRKPARLLLLRRFNDPEIGKSIEKLSRRWLKPYGHVFTLADKHFRRSRLAPFVSWFSFNPVLLIWRLANIPISWAIRLFDRARAGPILVWSARDFRNLGKRLVDRYGLNLEMERTQRKAVMVRTSDPWWRHVALLLMHAADVIVVDVTEVAGGTIWELETMLRERVGDRVVFVARQDRAADAASALATHGFPAREISHYTPDGRLIDSARFRMEMLSVLQRARAREG